MARRSRKQNVVAEAEGFVKAVSEKEVNTKRGKSKVYSFRLSDDNWYRTGFKDPDLEKGDKIAFEYTEGDYGNEVDVDSIEILEEAPEQPANSGPGKSGGSSTSYDDTQMRITFQASRNSAIAVVAAALQAEAVKLPAAQNKKFEAVTALVDELAEEYFRSSMDTAGMKAMLEEGDEELPEEEGEEPFEEGDDD